MNNPIIARLRHVAEKVHQTDPHGDVWPLMMEAALQIERLEEEASAGTEAANAINRARFNAGL